MARTRSKLRLLNRNEAIEDSVDSTISQTIAHVIETYKTQENEINYEGKVYEFPSQEQIKIFFEKYNKIFKDFSIRYNLLPLYYLAMLSPILFILLVLSSPNSHETSFINENFSKKESQPFIKNDTLEESASANYEAISSKNFNFKEAITLINQLNFKIFKLSEQIKQYQTHDQVSYSISQALQNVIQTFEKNQETRNNGEKAQTNQKFGLLSQKLANIEFEMKKLNNEMFFLQSNDNTQESDSNYKIANREKSNFLTMEINNIHSEIAGFKEYCLENAKFHEFSFQKQQNKIFQDFKFWIENNFVSKTELVKFLNKNNETKFNIWNYISFQKSDKNTNSIDLNQIKDLIKQALYIYNADKTGMVDFALESAGASIITSRCSASYNKGQPNARLFGIIPLPYYHNSPRLAIQPQVLPGECWAFKGSKGKLTIRLMATIFPTAFSIEHIPIVLTPNGKMDSAMHDFSVYGFENQASKTSVILGNYQYDINSPEYLQYFPVQIEVKDALQIIEFRIESNHGNKEYTCIYRVRVHGILE